MTIEALVAAGLVCIVVLAGGRTIYRWATTATEEKVQKELWESFKKTLKKLPLEKFPTYEPIANHGHTGRYTTKIEQLFLRERWRALTQELKNREMLDYNTLNEYITSRLNVYKAKPGARKGEGINYTASYFDILDLHVSSLIHEDSKRIRKKMKVFKTLSHLLDVKGGVIKNKKVEGSTGWKIESFLARNIYALYNFLIRIHFNDISVPGIEKAQTKKQILDKLKKELVLEIETLRVYRNTKFIQCCNDKERQHKLLKAHAKNMAKHIGELRDEGEEYCCGTGWMTHAVYVSFVKTTQDIIVVRIDNLGAGHKDYHKRVDGDSEKKGQVKPYILAYLKQDYFSRENEHYDDCINYLYGLSIADWSFKKKDALEKIYSEEFKNSYSLNKLELSKDQRKQVKRCLVFDSKEKQSVGNCVVRNFSVGLEIRTHYDAQKGYLFDYEDDDANKANKLYLAFFTACSDLVNQYCKQQEEARRIKRKKPNSQNHRELESEDIISISDDFDTSSTSRGGQKRTRKDDSESLLEQEGRYPKRQRTNTAFFSPVSTVKSTTTSNVQSKSLTL